MCVRWLCLAALAATATVLAGCGGVGVSGANEATGNLLAVYSSLPLQGPAAASSAEIVDGERLALAQAGGHVGKFKVGYVSLDDANPQSGKLDPEATSTNAKTAAQDTSTIAYLGELGSPATAVSLPLINAAGILQVSPSSPYVGLTSSLDAGQDEPERFYPSGKRSFGRLQTGDPGQADAQLQLMRTLGVRKLYVLDDQDPFALPLAEIVSAQAQRAGIALAAHDSILTTAPTQAAYAGEAEKIARAKPDAVFFAGGTQTGTAALWRALHRAEPKLLLLGTSALEEPAFTGAIGAAGSQTYLTTPILPLADYPPPAARVLADYRRRFGGRPGPYALYGYETMSVVLDAIRRAADRGNDRQTVIDRFFQTKDRHSVLGTYSVLASGETTLSRYGVDRVSDGRAVFYRAFDVH
ncbi:MAG TPA: branched-chain amino acid ABC transporter substrate-binding protein [Solirubrobacteraceae bacterium]|nr:branched-chain amino acid ABC transporter substrate-binding protein [Solirubrobacteraceae bacterium]